MKKIKFLLLGIVSILGISFSSASYFSGGVEYENGIYRNERNGILTLIYNDKVISITDKYLGQNIYYFSGDTTQLDFSGFNIYARGNNHNFSDLVFDYVVPNDFDFSSYGPGNYFDSGATYFYHDAYSNYGVTIYGYENLWGGEDNTPDSRKGPCYVGRHMFNYDEGNLLYDILVGLANSSYNYDIQNIFFSTYTYQNKYYPDWDAGTKTRYLSLFGWIDKSFEFSYFGTDSISYGTYETWQSFAPVRCVRNAVILPTSNNRTLEYQGSLENLPEEVEPDEPVGGGVSLTGASISSLYYNCLGPVYNTPDGLPPAYCYDSSGELNPGRFEYCFETYNEIDTGIIQDIFCSIGGVYQEVDLVEDGSGYSLVPGDTTPNVLEYFNSGYSVEYFEEFLNKTGYFFKCPFPYTQKFVVRPKLITLLNGFDLAVPINCAFAGFERGKSLFAFSNSGHFIQSGPLLNFEGENANTLYRFFDFCIIFVFILILSKVFKLFK